MVEVEVVGALSVSLRDLFWEVDLLLLLLQLLRELLFDFFLLGGIVPTSFLVARIPSNRT